jgi:hypothetical protein
MNLHVGANLSDAVPGADTGDASSSAIPGLAAPAGSVLKHYE